MKVEMLAAVSRWQMHCNAWLFSFTFNTMCISLLWILEAMAHFKALALASAVFGCYPLQGCSREECTNTCLNVIALETSCNIQHPVTTN